MARTESPWSTETQFTTLEDDGGGVDPSTLAPARINLEIINPKKSQLSDYNRYSWAHSQMDYVVPVGVLGGRPPFTFSFNGPAGSSCRDLAPWWNPKMVSAAEVTLPAGVTGNWTVTVTDQDGNTDTVTVIVSLNDARFLFVDPAGDDSNPGTIASPKKTFSHVWAGGRDTSPYVDQIVVLRAGNYAIPPADTGYLIEIHNQKPKSVIGFPGETAEIVGDAFSSGYRGFSNNINGAGPASLKGISEMFYSNITYRGNASWYKFLYWTKNHVWYKIKFYDIDMTLIGQDPNVNDNWGGINYENSTVDGNKYISTIDIYYENCRSAQGNNHVGLQFYTTGRSHSDIVESVNCTYNNTIWYKSTNQHFVVTSLSAWDTTETWSTCWANGETYAFPFDDITAETSVAQYRYCRLKKIPPDGGQGQDIQDGMCLRHTENSYGNHYADRCVVIAGIRPQEPKNGISTGNITRTLVLNNKGWWGFHIPDHYNVDQHTIADYFKDDNWANYIDTEGRLLSSTGLRYQIGWEV